METIIPERCYFALLSNGIIPCFVTAQKPSGMFSIVHYDATTNCGYACTTVTQAQLISANSLLESLSLMHGFMYPEQIKRTAAYQYAVKMLLQKDEE